MSHRSVSSTINRCFDRVYVTYANMTKRDSRNSHVLNPVTNLISTRGSNLHFESAFKTFANTYSHMMLLEPDTYPVKASWLDAMLSETYTEHWHIGARMIYSPRFNLGYMPYRDWYQRHINGNGVYKLNDACYSTFRKLVRDSYGDKAYDVSTAYYLQSWRNVRVMQSIGWRFGYSGVLVDVGVIGDLQDVENVGGENVVLVHGKARFVENAWINFMRY